MPLISPARRRSFQRRVLTWYADNARDLPWRSTRDPYAVFVSEILSHQTQISRVVPVYHALLARYPTVRALADASPEAVKAITDPLGYKVRGRWLHDAALQVADRGGFPTTLAGLRRLRGVGDYTAGAMMCFAYRVDTPAVDTNVRRVIARHFGRLIGSHPPPRLFGQLAAELIPRGKATC